MIKLGIRVANSITAGRGHFERCFAISNHISEKIFWFLDEKSYFFESRIKNNDEIIYEKNITQISHMIKTVNENRINIILIDSYNIDINSISYLSKKIPICVFQDSSKLLDVQMIICPHPIELLKHKNSISLCGPMFAPISSNFVYNKVISKDDNINILISMGAYDSLGVTLNIIKSIRKLSLNMKKSFKTRIVLGEGSPIINKIKELIKNDMNFNLITGTKDMNEIYNNTSIALGAPGLSHMERLYFGLPTILIAQNNIHESLVDKWVSLGCGIKCENSISSIQKKLSYVIKNKKIRYNLIKNGRNLVDGKGSLRIVEAMLKIVKIYD